METQTTLPSFNTSIMLYLYVYGGGTFLFFIIISHNFGRQNCSKARYNHFLSPWNKLTKFIVGDSVSVSCGLGNLFLMM